MEVLLFVLILLQLTFAVIFIKTLIHPIIILKTFCAFSAFILMFYSEIWGLYISFETLLIFTTGLLWVDLGFFMITVIYNRGARLKGNSKKKIKKHQNKQFSITGLFLILSFMIITVIAFLNSGKAYIQFGNGIESFSSSVMMLKQARKFGDVNLGIWQYAITACTIIGIVYMYACLKEWLQNGFSKRILIFSLPVIATLVIFFMTGRRSFLLNIILIFLILTYEYALRKYKVIPLKFQLKFLTWVILLFSAFYFFFVTAGRLLLKGGSEGEAFFNSFAIYLSGGIASFDKVYESYSFTSTVFGQNMFRIFYEIMNFIPGINFPTDNTINETLYAGNNFATNVYTVNLPYMADFGYLGVVIGNILIGCFYAILFIKSKNEEEIGFWNLLYAFFLISLLSYTGSERYFVPMTINIQYILLFIILLRTPLLYKGKLQLQK